MMTVLYWRFRYAMAPCRIFAEMAAISSVPSGSRFTEKYLYAAKANAISAAAITRKGTYSVMVFSYEIKLSIVII